ncbi:alpha/beta-hydrolase [Guyanagaster necrorhizus]|uniref:Alpha/beta-hydrolase n=1 Tax=Guyanagaster necrorhizus TaxID=856835 RepID=A0A9P8APH7_9AGAR|nr:alpha/beta-hydrolase [Guyanagaster necrorhizus MCA 3950]KAG7441877.1 alpha/beta-hydrolase [Guyanagaster necrorhizus MCA 3950]
MLVDNHIIETSSSGTTLKAAVKRYRPPNGGTNDKPASGGYILVFAHGTGFRNEHWEITIRRIFTLARGVSSRIRILEAWAVDAQTHGASATMNEETIEAPDFNYPIQDYAEACANVYNSLLRPTIRDSEDIHKLILIGHSAGASAAALSTAFCDHVPFHAMILVEPTVWPAHITNTHSPTFILASKTIPRRRDSWSSKAEARAYLKKRAPWALWDHRILDIYIEHGIVPHPTKKGGVSLACTPRHEAMPFITGDSVVPLTELDKTHKIIPIHLVYGERNDLFTREKQDSLQQGRKFASITRIPGAGHLVVQEAPDKVGDVIFNILRDSAQRSGVVPHVFNNEMKLMSEPDPNISVASYIAV